MKINIENPNKLVNFVEKSLTSWKIHNGARYLIQ